MTTKAKLNVQHDYITLRIAFPDGGKFNLTRSRNGTSASGILATREALTFFDRWIDETAKQKKATIGVVMQQLRDVAERSGSMQDLIKSA